MNSADLQAPSSEHLRRADVIAVLARWLLGAVFIYMGLSKALHPVEFLKLVRQYDALDHHVFLNLVASTLPWLELFFGLLLVMGIAVRGAATMLLAMLVPFSVLVLLRALKIQEAEGLPFCAIKFDCGCGSGEVFICRKLVENVFFTTLAAALIFWPGHPLCLRHTILTPVTASGRA